MPSSITTLPHYTREGLLRVVPVLVDHITHFGEIAMLVERGEVAYYFEHPTYAMEGLFWKDDKDAAHTLQKLDKVVEILQKIPSDNFTAETTKDALWGYASEAGKGNVLWPMRYALSGRDKSPDPFTLAGVLGKDVTLHRILLAQQLLSTTTSS